MLERVLRHLRNWFVAPDGIHSGKYTVEDDGSITLPFLMQDQYFRIVGSVLNDGVYKYPAANLKPEVFIGTVWAMAVPKAVLELVSDMEAWEARNGEAATSPFASESFGGYSYSKQYNAGAADSSSSVMGAFKDRLNQWRKI